MLKEKLPSFTYLCCTWRWRILMNWNLFRNSAILLNLLLLMLFRASVFFIRNLFVKLNIILSSLFFFFFSFLGLYKIYTKYIRRKSEFFNCWFPKFHSKWFWIIVFRTSKIYASEKSFISSFIPTNQLRNAYCWSCRKIGQGSRHFTTIHINIKY